MNLLSVQINKNQYLDLMLRLKSNSSSTTKQMHNKSILEKCVKEWFILKEIERAKIEETTKLKKNLLEYSRNDFHVIIFELKVDSQLI